MRVYLSGPMTGLPEFNYPYFNRVAKLLRERGYEVENPAENTAPHDPTWENWMRLAIKQMADCESIALLKGWENSKGALVELKLASDLGMSICTVGELVRKSSEWTALHLRAEAILGSDIRKRLNSEEVDFLASLRDNKIVWGTPKQQKIIDVLQAKL